MKAFDLAGYFAERRRAVDEALDRYLPATTMRNEVLERSPLRRMTTADDIAEAVVFLASDRAKNISGQVLSVNAGEPAA